MGWLRVFLAISVVCYHSGHPFGFAGVGGATAVQAFFVVSGFYMALVLNEKYSAPSDNAIFYKKRAVRIYGLYWPVLAIYLIPSLFLYAKTHSGPLASIFQPGFHSLSAWLMLIGNFVLVGLDGSLFFVFDPSGSVHFATNAITEAGLSRGIVVQPAWSLSPELLFYLIAPFIVRRKASAIAFLAAGSLALRVAGLKFGLINDPWSYRFFPFELFHFLIGSIAYKMYDKARERQASRWDMAAVAALFAALFSYQFYADLSIDGKYADPGRLAFLSVLFFSLPSLFRISRQSKLDRTIGELSYAIYLVHMIVISTVIRLAIFDKGSNAFSLCVLIVSIVFAWLLERYVGLPVERWRERLGKLRNQGAFMRPR